MNLREAALFIGVNPKTVWDWYAAGEIEGEICNGRLELLDHDVMNAAAKYRLDPSFRRRDNLSENFHVVVQRYNAGDRPSDIAADLRRGYTAVRNMLRRARERGLLTRERARS